MKRSTERILTTHTGSLPRPESLWPVVFGRERGEPVADFVRPIREAVAGIVHKQIDHGIDVVNDGEQGKASYTSYTQSRLSGFDGPLTKPAEISDPDYPEYFARLAATRPPDEHRSFRRACIGPIAYRDVEELQREIDFFTAALEGVSPEDTFLTAASPGIISVFMPNQYYGTHEEYLYAVADAMKTEYDAIHRAGFVVQIDCPDLALSRPGFFRNLSLEEFRKAIATHVEALNHATRDIPSDRLRMHLCWGNYEGPHHRDVPFSDIVDIVLGARPNAISFEASNPRHAHEWKIWRDVKLPEGKTLIPGVLDSTTNFIEHPELVAQRITSFAELVGRENVLAGTDCGFATGAATQNVDPKIAWAKFDAMAEGARIASKMLWS